ncbi:zinc finger CCHC domain-containing protein 2 isoform X2 [Scleropages formosus]|uniref:Zinc finger CCHC domain-containing protein 2-like n=2 Tax=Scleropages formosus TaxID=113540 RepID=A0A8C9U307_SCLFO|nr:zinc finger CCHC domain-containing protein 2-like isoform X2 [Scleropages formosus]
MLEMKLPGGGGGGRAAEDRAKKPAADGQDGGPPSRQHPMLRLDKEAVFEWFGLHLSPARRIEFMCGLLHMCQPLELRFLGSCLEDLARKDFHVLRDFEIRANSPSDLGLLSDVGDPVVRSKLLVSLSLLGSENRECAGLLFRVLSHADLTPSGCEQHLHDAAGDEPAGPDAGYGRARGAGARLEQMALLFTMASLHPAFPFHQREAVREKLERLEKRLEEDEEEKEERKPRGRAADARNKVPKRSFPSPSMDSRCSNRVQSPLATQPQASSINREAVYIEKIVLKGISRNRSDREYNFVVKWSDASSVSITKTHRELEDFLLKLPKEQVMENFEKNILRLLSQGDMLECRDLERTLRDKFLSAPPAFRQKEKVCSFFLRDSSGTSVSRCMTVPPGKTCKPPEHFTGELSEASSQEEDLEPLIPGHRKKHGSKSPSLGLQSNKNVQADSWRQPQAEHNGVTEWRRKTPVQKSILEPYGAGQQKHLAEEQRNSLPVSRNRTRPPGAGRDKAKKYEDRATTVSNGVIRPAPLQLMEQSSAKGPGRDAYGETSSESYSSPSSPQHDGQESLESEDDKDRDTDSNSDDFGKGSAENLRCKAVAGAAVATVRPMIPVAQREGASCLQSPLSPSELSHLTLVQPMTYMVQNSTSKPEATQQNAEGKAAGGLMVTIPAVFREPLPLDAPPGDSEKAPMEPTLLTAKPHLSGPPPSSPVLQPPVQRFRTAPLPPSSESTVHQPPMGAISVIPSGPAYVSPLQPAYPGSDSPEPHVKCLHLPTGPPSSYGVPGPAKVVPSLGAAAAATSTVAQAQVVPPHTTGPAPTPNPTLTHSTAQNDSNLYINGAACCGSAEALSQQQQPGPPQQAGCGACGCRGNCGNVHAPSYCYPPQVARHVFSIQPFIQLTSLCGGSYLSQAAQGGGATQMSFFPPSATTYSGAPLLHVPSEHVLGTQTGYSLQQMAAFSHFYPPLFPSVAVVSGTGGAASMKKNGNASCYNCGVSGHYAQDCKQPLVDTTQQGGFRLKFVTSPSTGGQDKGD